MQVAQAVHASGSSSSCQDTQLGGSVQFEPTGEVSSEPVGGLADLSPDANDQQSSDESSSSEESTQERVQELEENIDSIQAEVANDHFERAPQLPGLKLELNRLNSTAPSVSPTISPTDLPTGAPSTFGPTDSQATFAPSATPTTPGPSASPSWTPTAAPTSHLLRS